MFNMKICSIFSGIGGIETGFLNTFKNSEIVFSSEIDKKTAKAYELQFGHQPNDDITKVDAKEIPDHDILVGGFPCQPFSIAGKQLGFSHATQGTLFFNIIEIIKTKTSRVVFLENVKNLASHDNGNTFKVLLGSLEEIGYKVHYKILNGTTYGNRPQNRERIFIVAFRDEKDFIKFSFPKEIPLTTTINDCLEKGKVNENFYQTNKNSPVVKKILDGVTNKNTIYQYRRYYLRENKGSICPTLTANMGTGGHNVPLILDDFGVRKLTPRECFNFQGFPISFVLPKTLSNSSLYKQAGNSVVMPVVKRIAEEIINAIK